MAFASPVVGEIQKTRPAIVISNDAANSALNRVIVVPITSSLSKLYPGEAIVTINGEQRKAMADQLTTASKQRLSNKVGALSRSDLTLVENAVLLQLGMRR